MGAAETIAPAPYRVTTRRAETEDVVSLKLVPESGARIAYLPGQFTMLYAFGAGEVPISISGDPADATALEQTVRAVGSATGAICELREGDQVGVRGPFGHGWPQPESDGDDLVLVAGGLGLAPLRSALYRALGERTRLRRVILLYGGREPEQLLFRDELERWLAREDLDCELIVDVAAADWRGRVGVVPSLIERLEFEPERTTGLICGPELMMRFSAQALLRRGLDPSRIFLSVERNMRCAVGHCGHCQWGSAFVCRDGPVFGWDEIAARIGVRSL